MVQDPAPANFWRSAHWVIEKNRKTLYDHSKRKREVNCQYKKTEKGRAANARYDKTEKGRARDSRYARTEKGREKGRACQALFRDRKSFNNDPLRFIKKKVNFRLNQLKGVLHGQI